MLRLIIAVIFMLSIAPVDYSFATEEFPPLPELLSNEDGPGEEIIQEPQISPPPPAAVSESYRSKIEAPDSLSNRKISLELRSMDIINVFKILSDKSGLKIIAGKNVRGTVSLFLKDVDVFKALTMILETNELAYELDDSIIKVTTAMEYEKAYGRKFNDKRDIQVVKLNHAKAADLLALLNKLKTNVGEIIHDERMNSLVIVDLPEAIEEIMKVIKMIDHPDKQVLIEAKIVQILLNDDFKMGVDWQYVFSEINERKVEGGVKGNFNILANSALGAQFDIGTIEIDNYAAMLKVLETVGETNLVSTPRITTINNTEARILVGTKEAYVTSETTSTGSGVVTTAESVTFVDVGVKLFVTPTIGEDNFIKMKIRPEVSSVDREMTTGQGNSIPIVRTSETETTVLVKDGVSIVIAGLIEDRKLDTQSQIPILGHIPILGYLFRSTSKVKAKTDLVVFLTPHIVNGNIKSEEFDKYFPKDKE
ncbi:MAG: secretin N-terminal domain-containing protein [bacterium]